MKTKIIIIALFLGQNLIAQNITILHTNDIHSKLCGFGPESEYSPLVTNNDSTLGGISRLATMIKTITNKNPDNTLVFDAGDFLMGSLFHVAETQTAYQLNLMHKLGYNCVTLGNHEFDYGPEVLANIIEKSLKNGNIPQIIASNMVFDPKSVLDNKLENLYNNTIKPYTIIEKNGLKIGIIGIMGTDAAAVAPASKPVTFANQIKTANKYAKLLKTKHNVNLVIILSHSGLYHNNNNNSYYGEDIDMAKKVPFADIILSGHTHVPTPEYIKIGNTYIVQTGSYANNLGKIDLVFDNGKISKFDFDLLPVNDKIKGDSAIQQSIEKQIKLINSKYLAQTSLKYHDTIAVTNFNLTMNYNNLYTSNLGPFIADASKYYLDKTSNKCDFSIVASGTIREDILKGINGNITTADVFRVMSLGNGTDSLPGYPLAMMYLTGHEIKKLMEILIISRAGGGDGFIYFSGIKVYYNSKKGLLRKVQKIEINNTEINYSKKQPTLYSMAANTYLLSFIGRVKKMSHGLVKIVPKDKNGNIITNIQNQIIDINKNKPGLQEAKEWLAVIEFMKSFDKNKNQIPVIPSNYLKPDNAMVDTAK